MPEVTYHVEHRTHYTHAGRVATSQHVAHLEPRALPRQRVLSHELSVDPAPASITRRIDYFGSPAHYITVLTPYLDLDVLSRATVAMAAPPPFDPETSLPWEEVRDNLRGDGLAPDLEVVEFTYGSPYVALSDALAEAARDLFTPGRPIVSAAVALMHQIHRDYTFLPNSTSIATPVTRVLEDKHGVCQDFAHLAIGCLRSLGLAARYVSGYLLTDPPPGQPRLVGADASHAWLSVYCPQLGWIDLDPTNDVVPDVRHITIGWGRDYGDVSPLRGVVLGGDAHALHVGVSVMPA